MRIWLSRSNGLHEPNARDVTAHEHSRDTLVIEADKLSQTRPAVQFAAARRVVSGPATQREPSLHAASEVTRGVPRGIDVEDRSGFAVDEQAHTLLTGVTLECG